MRKKNVDWDVKNQIKQSKKHKLLPQLVFYTSVQAEHATIEKLDEAS